MTVLRIPRINDGLTDFDKLFALWERVKDAYFEDFTYDFSCCRFLQPNAVAFLCGLAKVIEEQGGTVTIDWPSIGPKVEGNLKKNGFFEFFGGLGSPYRGTTIPLRRDAYINCDIAHDEVISYLSDDWLGRGWVNISSPLRDAIAGRMWEIYANAFEHSRSSVGVFSCGQYFPNLETLKLTVVDFGLGIPTNVRDFLGRPRITSESALKWAFQRGTTTKPIDGMERGLGLDLLKDFVRLNKGQLEVFSNDGYVSINETQEDYTTRTRNFGGTIVHITLKCDERHYYLSSEDRTDEDELF